MKVLFGENYALKLLGTFENEMVLIPGFKKLFGMFIRTVFIVQLIQCSSLALVSIHQNFFLIFGFILIPTLFFLTRTFYFLSLGSSLTEKIVISIFLFLIAFINGIAFMFFYFKEEFNILNFGKQLNIGNAFELLSTLIFSESAYIIFSLIIILFFQIMYIIPILIFDKQTVNSINKLKEINGELRRKRR
jgi:hypothetical protein